MFATGLMKVLLIVQVDNHKGGKSKRYYWQALDTMMTIMLIQKAFKDLDRYSMGCITFDRFEEIIVSWGFEDYVKKKYPNQNLSS